MIFLLLQKTIRISRRAQTHSSFFGFKRVCIVCFACPDLFLSKVFLGFFSATKHVSNYAKFNAPLASHAHTHTYVYLYTAIQRINIGGAYQQTRLQVKRPWRIWGQFQGKTQRNKMIDNVYEIYFIPKFRLRLEKGWENTEYMMDYSRVVTGLIKREKTYYKLLG